MTNITTTLPTDKNTKISNTMCILKYQFFNYVLSESNILTPLRQQQITQIALKTFQILCLFLQNFLCTHMALSTRSFPLQSETISFWLRNTFFCTTTFFSRSLCPFKTLQLLTAPVFFYPPS